MQWKIISWSAFNFKSHATLMRSTPEPAIWLCDTGQLISCFDSCQLTITWMPNIDDVSGRYPLSIYFLEYETPLSQICTDGRTLLRSHDYLIFSTWLVYQNFLCNSQFANNLCSRTLSAGAPLLGLSQSSLWKSRELKRIHINCLYENVMELISLLAPNDSRTVKKWQGEAPGGKRKVKKPHCMFIRFKMGIDKKRDIAWL